VPAVLDDLAAAHALDPLGRHPLEAGDVGERDGDAPSLADGDDEELTVALRAPRLAAEPGADELAELADEGAARDRLDVEDEGDVPVAEHGGSRVQADLLDPAGDGLDDDLLVVEHTVDEQPEALVVCLEHRDGARLVGLRLEAEHL